MSLYKDQLISYLKGKDLKGQRILSIGSQHDDRKYFKSVECEKWMTMDISSEFKPDVLYDVNKDLFGFDGDSLLPLEYFDSFDVILAFELWDYIYDPMTAHKNILSLLKTDGLYMGSYPFVYPHHEPVEDDALRYTDFGIKKIMTKAGFRTVEVVERVATLGKENLANFINAEGLRLSKKMQPYSYPVGYIVTGKK